MMPLRVENGAAPAYLERLAAPAWAWEFLRRNPAYQRDSAHRAQPSDACSCRDDRCNLERKEVEVPARRWGLLAFRERRSRRRRRGAGMASRGSAGRPSRDRPRPLAG